jgi:hypothetical protein
MLPSILIPILISMLMTVTLCFPIMMSRLPKTVHERGNLNRRIRKTGIQEKYFSENRKPIYPR